MGQRDAAVGQSTGSRGTTTGREWSQRDRVVQDTELGGEGKREREGGDGEREGDV